MECSPLPCCGISARLHHLSPLPELQRLSQLTQGLPACGAGSGEGSAGDWATPAEHLCNVGAVRTALTELQNYFW